LYIVFNLTNPTLVYFENESWNLSNCNQNIVITRRHKLDGHAISVTQKLFIFLFILGYRVYNVEAQWISYSLAYVARK
jgi:hypothetical protein